MKSEDIGPVIASRTYLCTADPKRTLEVELGQPRPHTDGGYLCHYRIITPKQTRELYAGGIDSVQALEMALQMIGVDLEWINREEFEGMLQTSEGEGPALHWPKVVPCEECARRNKSSQRDS